LILHCNANGVTLATGEEAQIDQAYALGVCEVAADAPMPE
jgi:hypothetical protein